MLKRTGFKRPQVERKRCSPSAAPAGLAARVTMARADAPAVPVPKPQAHRNPHVLAMARGKPCMFLWMFDCERSGGTTTVAAHENSHESGKGGARKADDHRSVWACMACHSAYDQGMAIAAEKKQAFARAMKRQIAAWREIAADNSQKPADRRAASWALERWEKTE